MKNSNANEEIFEAMVFLGNVQLVWSYETSGGDHQETLERQHFEIVQFKDKQ